MKVILYPGFFDPIHNGHISIAKKALISTKADKVIFIPCWNSPTKKTFSAKFIDRVKMIQIAIKTYSEFDVSTIEKSSENKSYTYLTIKNWKKENPKDKIYILIGSDQYEVFDTWNKNDYIRKNSKIIVYPRIKKNILKKNNEDILLKGRLYNVASSKLILKIEQDKINSEVLEYINNNGLYAIKRLLTYGVSNYRIIHSIQVANIAKKIGLKYGEEIAKKAFVAGLYHDFCKEASSELLIQVAKKRLEINEYISKGVLHGPVGAYIVQKYFAIRDNEIINAIENHVTLSEPNILLNKIVFCADKLAIRTKNNIKNRTEIYQTSFENIDKAYLMIKKELDKIYKGF